MLSAFSLDSAVSAKQSGSSLCYLYPAILGDDSGKRARSRPKWLWPHFCSQPDHRWIWQSIDALLNQWIWISPIVMPMHLMQNVKYHQCSAVRDSELQVILRLVQRGWLWESRPCLATFCRNAVFQQHWWVCADAYVVERHPCMPPANSRAACIQSICWLPMMLLQGITIAPH